MEARELLVTITFVFLQHNPFLLLIAGTPIGTTRCYPVGYHCYLISNGLHLVARSDDCSRSASEIKTLKVSSVLLLHLANTYRSLSFYGMLQPTLLPGCL
uniref:Uncharacterized protein n=1 Tax=Physcomitrium patens TaxID=3218 RepID=A0A2K1IRR7_PHYPA|nr:hypothetical protein PHYPA_026095 [Physcomitrium patens]